MSQETFQTYSELYFEDQNRQRGSANQPTFDLQAQIQAVKKIRVARVSVPFTYYIINSTNNTFTVIEDTGTSTVSVTIPVGNYTTSTFESSLKALLEAESIASGNSLTYTVAKSSLTEKITISATGNFLVSLTASSYITGFIVATAGGVATHTADNVINLTGPRNLYLRSNLADFLQRDSIIKDNLNFNNVLTQIPITVNSGDINTKDYDDTDFLNISMEVSDLTFYCTDDNDSVVDFNGSPWSVTLQVYKETSVL